MCLPEGEKLRSREQEERFKTGLSTWMREEFNRSKNLDMKEKI